MQAKFNSAFFTACLNVQQLFKKSKKDLYRKFKIGTNWWEPWSSGYGWRLMF